MGSGYGHKMTIPQLSPIQPVNVIIHQDPAPHKWVSQVGFLLLGSLLTILAGFGSEWLKTFLKKRRMTRELANEAKVNLDRINIFNFAWAFAKDNGVAISRVSWVLSREIEALRSDLFDHYFSQERPLLYEIDGKRNLISCYDNIRTAKEYLNEAETLNETSGFELSEMLVGIAGTRAYAFLDEKKIDYTQNPNIGEEINGLLERFIQASIEPPDEAG